MKKKEIAEAVLVLGAKCDAVDEVVAVRGGERIDLGPFYAGAAEAFGIAYLALTGQVGEDELEPARVMWAMAKHYLAELEGGEDE